MEICPVESLADLRDLYGVTTLVVGAALAAGALFGWLAERSDYCARSALDELWPRDGGTVPRAPNQLWQLTVAALVAMAGVWLATGLDLFTLDGTDLDAPPLALVGLFGGSLLFGAGMALSRGCISRLLVLSARGNSRAAITLVFTALFAWASISGVLAAPRLFMSGLLRFEHSPALSALLISGWIISLGVMLVIAWRRGGPDQLLRRTGMAALIGLLIPACLFITAGLGADDFEPVPVEGLRFTGPLVDTFNYAVYSTAFTIKFGVAIVVGTLVGAAISAATARRIKIEGFNQAPHPLRYILGAALMGFGGVLAGGCTVGWLLTGGGLLHGGVLIAFTGFALGNFSLRLMRFNGLLSADTAPHQA
jgi:uncharacterized membrane protein YedE/YeeE